MKRRRTETSELDVTSFLNLMVVLIPFLLISAVFSRVTIMELSVPTGADASALNRPKFAIEVIVRKAGMEIANGSSVEAVIPKKDGQYDMQMLYALLERLKARYPNKEDATILVEPDIEYDHRGSEDRSLSQHIHRRRAMKDSRRMKRMGRSKRKITGLHLTPLMDVFTILVFFLLFHSSSGDILDKPKEIELPDSVVETKPRETVVIMVSPEVVLVQGQAVIGTPELLDSRIRSVAAITERLKQLERNIIGISTKAVAEGKEVTILADKTVPFKVLKKIMSTCTGSGYGRISLAVIQKAAQV
jgi:biopolymer transport protein ExbD